MAGTIAVGRGTTGAPADAAVAGRGCRTESWDGKGPGVRGARSTLPRAFGRAWITRAGGRAAAAAVVCAAVAGLPGQAAADTPVPVWKPRGETVTGTATTAEAPELTPGTSYRDTLAGDGAKYYGVFLDDASSAYLSVFALPAPGTEVAYHDGISLELLGADGTRCDRDSRTFRSDLSARPIGAWVRRPVMPDADCQEAGPYVLKVTRDTAGTPEPGEWPMALRYMSEPGLKAGESPAPAGPYATELPAPVGGAPRRAEGGADFETAVAVGAGVWQDSIRPGGTSVYKVPVDWGRRLVLHADFSSAKVKPDADRVYKSDGVRVELYNPARGLLGDDSKLYDGGPARIAAATAPVAYANRFEDDDAVAAACFAGWHYVVVSVHQDVARFVRGAVPVTLRIGVEGGAQAGPRYDGDAVAAGFGVTGDDMDGADGAGGGPDPVLRLVGFGALGAGTLLVLLLAAWTVVARCWPGDGDGVSRAPGSGSTPTW